MKRAFAIVVLILTSPLWIIPFLCCYLTGWEDWSDIDGK